MSLIPLSTMEEHEVHAVNNVLWSATHGLSSKLKVHTAHGCMDTEASFCACWAHAWMVEGAVGGPPTTADLPHHVPA